MGAKVLVTADHGNADMMRDASGNPLNGHSNSPVPFIFADFSKKNSIYLLNLIMIRIL